MRGACERTICSIDRSRTIDLCLTTQTDQDGRPISAQLNFDPSRISTDPSKRREQTITAMHETTHGLGFTSNVFYNLNIRQTFNRNGKQVKRIVSPKVAEAAKNHYDCSDWGAAGGEIEDGGGSGTKGSHWEKRVLSDVSDSLAGCCGLIEGHVHDMVHWSPFAGIYDRKIRGEYCRKCVYSCVFRGHRMVYSRLYAS